MKLLLFCLLVISQSAFGAQSQRSANLLAIGQGVSSPSTTTTVNFSSGYTSESPLGTLYQNGSRVTGEYDRNDSSDAVGAEIGYGKDTWGIAAGYRKPNCANCDGSAAGDLGIDVGNIGVGIRFGKDLYAAGILFNPQGTHRFGLMGEINQSSNSASKLSAYGVGYSYVAQQVTFTIDASGRSFDDKTIDDKRILVTPGVMLRADIVQLTLNDRITLNHDQNNAAQTGSDNELWFGIGIGGDKAHLAVYSHYFNDLAIAGSFFF
jgi:hypothetical protein